MIDKFTTILLLSAAPPAPTESRAPLVPPAAGGDLRSEIAALERQRIVAALEACAGNQTHAAAMLGMSRRTFVVRLGEYQIPRPRKR